MKKALVITFAVALLGIVGISNSRHSATAVGGNNSTNTTSVPNSRTTNQASNPDTNFKDGTFTGDAADTPYGTVQVAAVISGGKITDIRFLQMPSDQGHSREVTAFSEPLLKDSTLQKQSADIDFISGATSTVYGYQESLQAALDKSAGASFIAPNTYKVA
ncbi:MAG TPA: FMN-binding protein [Nitrososphaera sp.]|nr:FMN-binding protein [Nitrososphaera sp.]